MSEAKTAVGSNGQAMEGMEQEESSISKYSESNRTEGNHCQVPNQQRHYNSSYSSNRRSYKKYGYTGHSRSRIACRAQYANPHQPLTYPKKDRLAYELDGQQKFTLKDSYFENLRCPSCVMNNLAQTYKHRGIPWCDPQKNYRTHFSDFYEGLNAELEDFYAFISPNGQDEVLRKATFYCISKSIKKLKMINTVKYYGSYSSGTYLPVSDIDLAVYCDSSYNVNHILDEIARNLFADGIIEKHCSFIPNSRIPLLKFYDSMTGIPINITVNTPKVMDRADYVKDNFMNNPCMLKLHYFMKYYLLYKGSNQVYHGGIGSYSLSLMMISFFQEPAIKQLIKEYESLKPSTLLARLLVAFLKRYSDIDFVRSHIISVQNGGRYIPASPLSDVPLFSDPLFNKKTSILRIEDHLEAWKNVSSGSFNSDLILNDFGHLLNMLFNPNDCHNDNQVSILGNAICIVDSFVDYRNILDCIFKKWFSHQINTFTGEKYDNFISNRNIFGKRVLEFEFKRFDDCTVEMILKDRIAPLVGYAPSQKGPSGRNSSNSGDNYSNNYPTYSVYHQQSPFANVRGRHTKSNGGPFRVTQH